MEILKKLKTGDKCTLDNLQKGQSGKVVSLKNENLALRRRLLDMGITMGVKLKIKKVAPLGDPVDIELRGYELCIRKSEMKNIEVEVI